jgi:hypothetical protein
MQPRLVGRKERATYLGLLAVDQLDLIPLTHRAGFNNGGIPARTGTLDEQSNRCGEFSARTGTAESRSDSPGGILQAAGYVSLDGILLKPNLGDAELWMIRTAIGPCLFPDVFVCIRG